MSSTLEQIFDKVRRRVTGAGLNINVNQYALAIYTAINWAQEEFCTVRWRFLQKKKEITTQSGVNVYDLFDNAGPGFYDFGTLRDVWINDGDGNKIELVRAQVQDIEILGAAMDNGLPNYFALSGVTTDAGWSTVVPAIWLGIPTPDDEYTVTVYYYRRLPELSGASTVSDVCAVYRDDPLVEGAVFRFMLDVAPQAANPESFYRAMIAAQKVLPYDGPMYPQKLQEKET